VFQFCPGEKSSSIARRALVMGGLAGAIGCGFLRVAHAAPVIVLPAAAGNTAFAFSHRSEEIWRAGRLMSLSSETVEQARPSMSRARECLRDFAW
jgi:hypothetical protein